MTNKMLIVFILGFILRIFKLDSKDLWYDEIWTLKTVDGDLLALVTKSVFDPYPPLYFMLIKLLTGLSESYFLIRLPSAVFGALSIIILYRLTRKMFDENIAIVAAFLLAISPLHIFYSQTARPYALVILLTLLCLYFLYELVNSKGAGPWIGFTISNILLLYTHLATIHILVAEIIVLGYYARKSMFIKKLAFSISAIFLSFLPWTIFAIMRGVTMQSISHHIKNPSLFKLLYIFYKFSIGLRQTTFIEWKVLVLISFLIFSFLFFRGLYSSFQTRKKEAAMLLSFVVIPLASSFISSFIVSTFFFRYLIFILPLYLIFIANGIYSLNKKSPFVFSIVLIYLYILLEYYFLIDEDNWYLHVGT